jgi:hypothetical protein
MHAEDLIGSGGRNFRLKLETTAEDSEEFDGKPSGFEVLRFRKLQF